MRRVVTELLHSWGRDDLSETASLCATELAANAILHTREPFDVAIRRWPGGVRVEVIDGRPTELPIPVPTSGSAVDITAAGTTGRGLQIVASLSRRWGFSTSETAKSVWSEIAEDAGEACDPPVVVLGKPPVSDSEPPAHPITLRLIDLPVRAAVASGVQVDELVRGLQLGAHSDPVDTKWLEELYPLLDLSAALRLAGRHAALHAAAQSLARFDLQLHTGAEALGALGDLNRLLERATNAGISREVEEFRAWLQDEVAHQTAGHPPRPCTLPD